MFESVDQNLKVLKNCFVIFTLGNDHRVKFRMSKELNRAESDIRIPTKSVSVRDFLAKFKIDAAAFGPVSEEGETVGVFGEGMEKENVRLGLNSLNFRKPIIRGIFVPGEKCTGCPSESTSICEITKFDKPNRLRFVYPFQVI